MEFKMGTIYLFILLLINFCKCKILLHSVEGEVTAENFTYWSLTYIGDLILELNSTKGDVDVYVSETLSKPGYEPDSYDLHSATCGLDVVEIPRNFKRPIGVGLYGHFLYNVSEYTLDIYLDTRKKYHRFESEECHGDSVASLEPSRTNKQNKLKTEGNKVKSKLKTVIARSGFWAFLEIFEMLFL